MTVVHLSTDLYDVTRLFSNQMSVCARAVKVPAASFFIKPNAIFYLEAIAHRQMKQTITRQRWYKPS